MVLAGQCDLLFGCRMLAFLGENIKRKRQKKMALLLGIDLLFGIDWDIRIRKPLSFIVRDRIEHRKPYLLHHLSLLLQIIQQHQR